MDAQEIRAVAVLAAAIVCAPSTGVRLVCSFSELIERYITSGRFERDNTTEDDQN